ncbi:unnamed protein product [Mytilus edulis]|uniref:Uncharacterized protein n=1 Tax=Mytilus edulis TaxID=6550 RepID=A0A8S3SHP5_MYTED|nr:unnamed protein product [Mytilus edulis]
MSGTAFRREKKFKILPINCTEKRKALCQKVSDEDSTEDLNGLWIQHTTVQSNPYTTVFNVSEVNHTWARDSGNCVYGWTLSGKRMFNSCRSDSCQTINANKLLPNVKKKPPFLWIDGYVVRSPVMEYYECLEIRNVNIANALAIKKNLTHNGVEKCSLFCQQDGKLKNNDFILLQNETCYCLPANTYKKWKGLIDEIHKSTEDCDIQCDDGKFDRCGGKTDLFSAYKLKKLPISAEIDGNCFYTPGSGKQVIGTKCKDTLKFKCEQVIKTGQNIDGTQAFTSVSRIDQSTIYSTPNIKEQKTEDSQNVQVSMYVGIAVALTILLILVIVLAVYIISDRRPDTGKPIKYTGWLEQRSKCCKSFDFGKKSTHTRIMISRKPTNREQCMTKQVCQIAMSMMSPVQVGSTVRRSREDVCYYDHNRDADTMYDATDTKGLIKRNEISEIYDHTREINNDYDVSHAYRQQNKTMNESVYSQSDF